MNTQLERIVAYLAGQDDGDTARLRQELEDPASDGRRLLACAAGLSRDLFEEATLRWMGLPTQAPPWPTESRPPRPPLLGQAVPWLVALFALTGLAASWGAALGQRRPAAAVPPLVEEDVPPPRPAVVVWDDCRKERQEAEQLRKEMRRLRAQLDDARALRPRTVASRPAEPKAARTEATVPIVVTRPDPNPERVRALQARLDAALAEIDRLRKAAAVRVTPPAVAPPNREKALAAELRLARRENDELKKELARVSPLARELPLARGDAERLRNKLRKAEAESKRQKDVADDLRAKLHKAEAEVERLRKPVKAPTRPHGDKGR